MITRMCTFKSAKLGSIRTSSTILKMMDAGVWAKRPDLGNGARDGENVNNPGALITLSINLKVRTLSVLKLTF